jgi:hypothetical protein
MRTLWLSLVSLSFLVACGGESTSDGSGGGGSGAQAGTGGGSNGGTSGNGGSGGGSGGVGGSTGGATGGGGAPCQALIDGYMETLKSAKECNPFIDMNECTGQVPNSLVCPCGPTYVNPANTQALATLKQIEEQAIAQNCLPTGCPAIACEQPALGTCEPDASGNSGSCQDLFTNDAPGG